LDDAGALLLVGWLVGAYVDRVDLLERSGQLAALGEACVGAARGQGSVLLVSGEPGIGKTALVSRFVTEVEHRVLWGTCDDLSVPRSLAPLTDLAGDVSDELRMALANDAPRARVQALMLDELSRSPTVVVLEDLHWADEATLDIVTIIGRRIAALPAVLVVTFREGEVAPEEPLWASLGSLPADRSRHLRLRPLSRAAVASLAGPDTERVYRLTGGNPFYVTELLASGSDELPSSVANAVLGRASRLGAAPRRLVELVSMVPSRTSTGVLDAVMPAWPAAAEEPERRQLLRVDVHHVMFRHEIARAAIRSSVPVARRRRLHAEIMNALLGLDADPAEIVHHAEEAGELGVVAEHVLVAARRAAAVESNREAFAHYRRAVDFADRLPHGERADLYEELARAAYLVERLPEGFSAINHSIALRKESGDREGVGRCLRRRARFHWYAGDGQAAHADAQAAVDVLEPLGGVEGTCLRLQLHGAAGHAGVEARRGQRLGRPCRHLGDPAG
jgi:predicted ATPase